MEERNCITYIGV